MSNTLVFNIKKKEEYNLFFKSILFTLTTKILVAWVKKLDQESEFYDN